MTTGISGSNGSRTVCAYITEIHLYIPLIDISLIEKDSSIIKEEVFKRNIDAAIIDLYYLNNEELSLFDIFEVAESELVAVVSKDNPLAGETSITYDDLGQQGYHIFQSDESSF